MSAFTVLKLIDTAYPIWEILGPKIMEGAVDFLRNPDLVSRFGDVIVWNGEKGQQVLVGLESLRDSTVRIENAVVGIEGAQLAMQGTLGVVQSVSIATLGVTSLSGGFMAWRLAALNRRLAHLSRRIDDVEGQIDAANKAHLRSSLQFLADYEKSGKEKDLDRSLGDARRAGNIYGQLAEDETDSRKMRLPVLNYRSRCYYLSLLVEAECLILQEQQVSAVQRLNDERKRLQRIARSTFSETIAKAPEAYLDPAMESDGVTLELITEVYRQARHAEAADDVEVNNAAEMFEHVRKDIYRRRGGLWRTWRPVGNAKKRYLTRLRYLLACIEDTNRIHSLRLLMNEAEQRGAKLRELHDQVRAWRKEYPQTEGSAEDRVLAYTFT